MPNVNFEENNFSPIIRALGKGKHGSRSLEFDEAYSAFSQILKYEVEDVQLGAFLMLLRVKEESPEEIAGFVKASRDSIHQTWQLNENDTLPVDIDWSSYAGKRKQQPWFVLVLCILAQQGYRCVVHGTQGHTKDRLYTEQVFQSLHLPIASNTQQVEQSLSAKNLCFVSIQSLSPRLQDLINMRPLFGLRSPVHTLCRLINPFAAKHSFSSIFHPAYAQTHQEAAQLLGDSSLTVFKGESGEIERKSDATCLVKSVRNDELSEEKWPRLQEAKQAPCPDKSAATIKAVFQGNKGDSYGELAVIGTLAICLKQVQSLANQKEAMNLATQLWKNRDKTWLD